LSSFANDITNFAYDPHKMEHFFRHIHATTKLVKWKVVGVDVGFDNSATLDPSGNTLGPFLVGQVVQMMTEVSNSGGTRTSAVWTITIETPIG